MVENREIRDRQDGALQVLLTEKGLRLWRRRSQQFDSTPTVSDSPASRDQLGREAFAQALVRRIRWMRFDQKNAPLLIHLHGPWGSGKTSILNLMQHAMRLEAEALPGEAEPALDTRRFHIVEFNAWRYQHVEPPWWSLLSAILDQTLSDLWSEDTRKKPEGAVPQGDRRGYRERYRWLAVKLALSHFWFRIYSIKSLAMIAGIGAIVFGMWLLSFRATSPVGLAGLLSDFKDMGALFTLIAGAFGALMIFLGVFFPKPEEAAERYVGSRTDPLLRLQKHVCRMVERLPLPLVVMVDDLDRCDAGFVVRFLEGIQTMFSGAPAIFIVAADRKWLHRSFESSYQAFEPVVAEPGKPLGFLFLEKTFQMSVAVPPLDLTTQLKYLRALLRYEAAEQEDADPEAKAQAQSVVGELDTESDIVEKVREQREEDRAAFARAAVVRLAAPDIQLQVTRHRLERFGTLLEPNPRSMKRLIMAYGMNQATDLLLERFTDLDKLALWTILSMRWPQLAAWLEENPEFTSRLAKGDDVGEDQRVPESLKKLAGDSMVRRVLKGSAPDPEHRDTDLQLVPGGLDSDTLRRFCQSVSTS